MASAAQRAQRAQHAQHTGPLYVGLQQPSQERQRGEERLRAARARRKFTRSLSALAITFVCLVATVTITVVKMEAGYHLDAMNGQLKLEEVQHQRYELQLQRLESLQTVASSAERMGMHPAPNYRALPIVVVHNAPQLRGRSVTVTLPPPPKAAGGGSLLGRIRDWLGNHR